MPKFKPLVLAVDDVEGGRVRGTYAVDLPRPLQALRVAIGGS